MKTTKYTVTVTVEVVSMDCVQPVLSKAMHHIADETHNGELVAYDGDSVKWVTKAEEVEV